MTDLPTRDQQSQEDCWDLSSLFPSDRAWEEALTKVKGMLPDLTSYRGRLAGGDASTVGGFLRRYFEVLEEMEALGVYAYLRLSEDGGDPDRQRLWNTYLSWSTEFQSALSFVEPELVRLSGTVVEELLHREDLVDFRIWLEKLLRYRPHILPEEQERILATLSLPRSLARRTFSSLNDVDLAFGTISTPEGERPLTHGTYLWFMEHPDRSLREQAYTRYLEVYKSHQHTLATLYATQVQQDAAEARLRNHPSSLHAALFADNVPVDLYTHLITQVETAIPLLHEYWKLRADLLELHPLRLFDTKVPLVKEVEVHYPYEQAVDLVAEALSPLGEDYTRTMREGLLGGWVDRYENRGKRSGAFSYGSYRGAPYILLNYDPRVIRHVFTLAHEAGHSMHSYYSARSNPFPHYQYSIFEAEVASTFNEELLLHRLLSTTEDPRLTLHLHNRHVDEIIGTYFRQTMFAEFELVCHRAAEEGHPLTTDFFLETYRGLLEKYFGPAVSIEELDSYECLRIPHFYRSFYVYQYATGITAAVTLSKAVIEGKEGAVEAYLRFLSRGGSSFPLETLGEAGVDLLSEGPYQVLHHVFAEHLEALKTGLERT
ncbi:oligoendopeptidase F [Spirochaeta thermophila]|uniref:Oligopeptidase F n=1 Tax=Winmispira thermophila (strain ATCC 49972 / DSM 6192 / RI 19.B1) TaxID=665571 RepID=E0RPK8_WINT6|nr:oligoendopeptidase F [Spirochaeta thermophila]ADN02790.1 oligoendopeptidase F [Spirochaeta thermophila DSM 6192]